MARRRLDPLHAAHYTAAAILIISTFSGSTPFWEKLVALEPLAKYGLCLALIVVAYPIYEMIGRGRK